MFVWGLLCLCVISNPAKVLEPVAGAKKIRAKIQRAVNLVDEGLTSTQRGERDAKDFLDRHKNNPGRRVTTLKDFGVDVENDVNLDNEVNQHQAEIKQSEQNAVKTVMRKKEVSSLKSQKAFLQSLEAPDQVSTASLSVTVEFPVGVGTCKCEINPELSAELNGNTLKLSGKVSAYFFIEAGIAKAGVEIGGELTMEVEGGPSGEDLGKKTLNAIGYFMSRLFAQDPALNAIKRTTSAQEKHWAAIKKEWAAVAPTDPFTTAEGIAYWQKLTFTKEASFLLACMDELNTLKKLQKTSNAIPTDSVEDYWELTVAKQWAGSFLYSTQAAQVDKMHSDLLLKNKDRQLDRNFFTRIFNDDLDCSKDRSKKDYESIQQVYCELFKAAFFFVSKTSELKVSDSITGLKTLYSYLFPFSNSLIWSAGVGNGDAVSQQVLQGRLVNLAADPKTFKNLIMDYWKDVSNPTYWIKQVELVGSVGFKFSAGKASAEVALELGFKRSYTWAWASGDPFGPKADYSATWKFALSVIASPVLELGATWVLSDSGAALAGDREMEMKMCFPAMLANQALTDYAAIAANTTLQTAGVAAISTLHGTQFPAANSTSSGDSAWALGLTYKFMKWVATDPDVKQLRGAYGVGDEAADLIFRGIGSALSAATDIVEVVSDANEEAFGGITTYLCHKVVLGKEPGDSSFLLSYETTANLKIPEVLEVAITKGNGLKFTAA